MYAVNWISFVPTDVAVLCFVRSDDSVLLIHKKRGLGAGKINGPGGKLEHAETPAEAAVRETREEVGITPLHVEHCGVLRFVFTDGYNLEVHVFVAPDYEGSLVETPEAEPFWQPVTKIPFDRMWSDDRLWLPHVLDGKTIDGRFVFADDDMLEWNIKVDGVDGSPLLIEGRKNS